MGTLHVHGKATGSMALANVIAPFQIPEDNEIFINHLKTTLEPAGANTTFVVEQSDTQNFASFKELDRQVMPEPGTFVSTDDSIEVPPGKWVRVRYVQSAGGAVSASLIGKTRAGGIQIGA